MDYDTVEAIDESTAWTGQAKEIKRCKTGPIELEVKRQPDRQK